MTNLEYLAKNYAHWTAFNVMNSVYPNMPMCPVKDNGCKGCPLQFGKYHTCAHSYEDWMEWLLEERKEEKN